ncbi:hypothetical protein [Archaeoglobus profundus]|uniref:Uncharacterized protein n=1 Tax=Archaeoglobus profundus (strain DSM 5631 / JCM 9629 / NBRC 100127 / Av18) TaxID=572546 RepID=D2REL1_ARCPA|nr:hypothetical protein [Archaeoglobus profundus]ADB58555.1 hypothetical protein Arcpr_1509 [Archaeoglobus profundus DSM 5631]
MQLIQKLAIVMVVVVLASFTFYVLPPLLYVIFQSIITYGVISYFWKELKRIAKEYLRAIIAGASGGFVVFLASKLSTPNVNLNETICFFGLGMSAVVFFMLLYLIVEGVEDENGQD